jgi:hypothetical protein
MEPKSPSMYLQVPATCPYPEPTPSNPHDPLKLPEYITVRYYCWKILQFISYCYILLSVI